MKQVPATVPGKHTPVAHSGLGALRKCALDFHFSHVLPDTSQQVVVNFDGICAHSQHHVTDSSDRFMAQEQNSAHPFTIFHQLGSGAHGTDPC